MESHELVLLEALVAILPYVVVGTAGWVCNKVGPRRCGANAPT